MEDLPDGLRLQRTTPTFDEESVPAGLIRAHRVADGVWGRLVVESGSLGFVFDDQPDDQPDAAPDDIRILHAGDHQVIPPLVEHHVVLRGAVRFAVEFHH